MDRIEQLRREKQKLMSRLQEVESILRAYEELQAKMQRLLEYDSQDVVLGPDGPRTTTRPLRDESGSRSREPDVLEFERIVREVLAEADTPLDRGEVFRRVTEKGHVVQGNPPENVVSTRLSRMQDVSGKRGLGFWLTAREMELFPRPKDGTDASGVFG